MPIPTRVMRGGPALRIVFASLLLGLSVAPAGAQRRSGTVLNKRGEPIAQQPAIGLPGNTGPAPSGTAGAAPAAAGGAATLEQVSRDLLDLAAAKAEGGDAQRRLAEHLTSLATVDPDSARMLAVAADLGGALAGVRLSESAASRLAGDLRALMAGAILPPDRVRSLQDDVIDTLEAAGSARPAAETVAQGLGELWAEPAPASS